MAKSPDRPRAPATRENPSAIRRSIRRRTRRGRRAPRRRGRTCRRPNRRSPTCSIPRSARAPPASARRPGSSRRRTIPSTAAPIFPPRTGRASRPEGFDEAPQSGYVGKGAAPGHEPVAQHRARGSARLRGRRGGRRGEHGQEQRRHLPRRHRRGRDRKALEQLLREGRPEFSERPWTPHRPPRPEKSEGGRRSSSSPISSRRATSRRRSTSWSRASSATTAPRCCSASPARARPSRWRR